MRATVIIYLTGTIPGLACGWVFRGIHEGRRIKRILDDNDRTAP